MRAPGKYTGLTVLQADLLSFLRHRNATGLTPTFAEMSDALEIASKGNVHRLLTTLEDKGYIRRDHNRARSITVFAEQQPVTRVATPIDLRRLPLPAIMRELARRGIQISSAGHPAR